MESHPSTPPRPSRPIQTPWDADLQSQGKQRNKTLHSSWDSLVSTQSIDNHDTTTNNLHRTTMDNAQKKGDVTGSSRLDRQQPIMIQNFELLKPSQLKFRRKSLSTANLYLSQASMHRQGTGTADYHPGNVASSVNQSHQSINSHHQQKVTDNSGRKVPESFPDKILRNNKLYPQNRNLHNASAKSPNSPLKQKRVTFSAKNTLHRYEPKPEEHHTWNGCSKHGYYNGNIGNNHHWFRQRDFIYPESYNSSTLPRKDSTTISSSNSGSVIRSNSHNENNVGIPIRMLLEHFNFRGNTVNSKMTCDENDNIYEGNNCNDLSTESSGQANMHTPTANNATTPIHSTDIDDRLTSPTSRSVSNGHVIQDVWSSERGQLDCNTTTRTTETDSCQVSSEIVYKERGALSDPTQVTTNNSTLPRYVEQNTVRHGMSTSYHAGTGDTVNEDLIQNSDICEPVEDTRQIAEKTPTITNQPSENSNHCVNKTIPQNTTPQQQRISNTSMTFDGEDNRELNNPVNNDRLKSQTLINNDVNTKGDDFNVEDDNSSIIVNPEDDYSDNDIGTANVNNLRNNDDTNNTKTANLSNTGNNQHQHQIPVTTFYDAFQEYEIIDSAYSTKQTPFNPVTTGPAPFTPNTFRRKANPSGILQSTKNNSAPGDKNSHTTNNVVSQKIIRLNFLEDIDPRSYYYNKTSPDSNSNNGVNRQNAVEFEGNMTIHGLQLRSNVPNTTIDKENDVSSSSRDYKPVKPNLTNNGRPPSQGDINARFLMNFYSSSGERKPNVDNAQFDQLSSSSSSRNQTPRDQGKRVSFQSGLEKGIDPDSDPVARSARGREMERRLFSSASTRSRAQEQPIGNRSRSASSSAGHAHLSVSGNGLMHKGDKVGVRDLKSSGKGNRLHSAERFLLKAGDTRMAGRTALNLRLEELVVSRSLSSRVKLTMERAKSNMT